MNGELKQSFWSSREIFAVIPKRLSIFDFSTFSPIRTGGIAWLQFVDEHTDDFSGEKYYTLPTSL